jgi:hypothetical protein
MVQAFPMPDPLPCSNGAAGVCLVRNSGQPTGLVASDASPRGEGGGQRRAYAGAASCITSGNASSLRTTAYPLDPAVAAAAGSGARDGVPPRPPRCRRLLTFVNLGEARVTVAHAVRMHCRLTIVSDECYRYWASRPVTAMSLTASRSKPMPQGAGR